MAIVPSERFLGVVGVVLLPLAVLAAAVPQTLPVVSLLAGLLLATVLYDAWQGVRRGVQLTVEMPELLRLQKRREGSLTLRLRNETGRAREIRLGLNWPANFEVPQPVIPAHLAAGTEWSSLTWNCTGLERGQFFFTECHVEAVSPLGFWCVREKKAARSEVRVYPNLLEDRKTAAAVFLQRGQHGIHAQRQTGKGREFEKLRDYAHGDSLDDVHWKASARRGRLVTKVFQVERTQEIYVIIDASRLSARSEALERFVTAGLLLGLAAEQQGDLFGLVTFDARVKSFLRAKNGAGHFDACRDALYTLQPSSDSPDFEELCAFIRTRLRKRALLFFLTSLDDPVLAEQLQRGISLLTRQHLVLVNMLRPPGVRPLFSGAGPGSLDGIYQNLAGHLRWQGLRELEIKLKQLGAWFHLLEHEKLSPQLLEQYLQVKGRQLL